MTAEEQYKNWTDEQLAQQLINFQRRCWNGEAANVYPLMKRVEEACNARGIPVGQIKSRARR